MLFNLFKLCNASRMRQRQIRDSDTATGRGWAYAGTVLGGAVSIAANVAHSFVPPMTDPAGWPLTQQERHDWSPNAGAVIGAVFWPVALFVAIEIIARVDWPAARRWVFVRFGGLVPVAAVAAVVSYRHMSGLLDWYGEDSITSMFGPLAVDGLMVMAAGALIATGAMSGSRRPVARATATATPAVVAATPAASSTPARATATPDAAKPTKTPRPRPAAPAARVSDSDKKASARRRFAAGETHLASLAMSLGTNKRNVERWTKDLRDSDSTPDSDTADPDRAAAAAN